MAFRWVLNVNWVYMSLIAASIAAVIHLVSSIVAVVRIGRFKGIILVVIFPIYTFISCFFIQLSLQSALVLHIFTWVLRLDDVYYIWGLGFGVVYVILKVIITGYLK